MKSLSVSFPAEEENIKREYPFSSVPTKVTNNPFNYEAPGIFLPSWSFANSPLLNVKVCHYFWGGSCLKFERYSPCIMSSFTNHFSLLLYLLRVSADSSLQGSFCVLVTPLIHFSKSYVLHIAVFPS